MSTPRGDDRVRETRQLLVERFPNCFRPQGELKRPLAVGIRQQLIERCPDIPPKDISAALRDYTRGRRHYRSQLRFGAPRVNLDGAAVGFVTAEEAHDAGVELIDHGFPVLAATIARSLLSLAA